MRKLFPRRGNLVSRFLRDRDANAAVEFAFIVPLMLTLLPVASPVPLLYPPRTSVPTEPPLMLTLLPAALQVPLLYPP